MTNNLPYQDGSTLLRPGFDFCLECGEDFAGTLRDHIPFCSARTFSSSSNTDTDDDFDSSSSSSLSDKFVTTGEEEEEDLRTVDDIFNDLMIESEKLCSEELNSFTSFEDCGFDLSKIAKSTIEIAQDDSHPNNLHARAKVNEDIAKYEILSVLMSYILADDPNCPSCLRITLEERITKKTGGNISWDI